MCDIAVSLPWMEAGGEEEDLWNNGVIEGEISAEWTLIQALLNTALDQFAIPGDASFPLNQAFEAPRDRQDAETLRQYVPILFYSREGKIDPIAGIYHKYDRSWR